MIAITPFILLMVTVALGATLFTGAGGVESGTFADKNKLIVLCLAYVVSIYCFFRSSFVRKVFFDSTTYFVFLAYVCVGMLWSDFPSKVAVNLVHYIGVLLSCICLVVHFRANLEGLLYFLLKLLGFLVVLNVLGSFFFPAVGIHEITGRWQGFTGNPNTFGPLCLSAIWASLSFWKISHVKQYVIPLVVIVFSVVGLIGCFSATSIALTFGVIILLYGAEWILSSKGGVKWGRALLVTFMMLSVFLALFAFMPNLLDWNILLSSMGRDATLTGRTELWGYAIQLFGLKPFLGWSFDSLMSATVIAGKEFDFTYFQFHNGYLDVLVKGGIIGLLIVCALYFSILTRVFRLVRKNRDAFAIFTSYVFVILLHNITEASFAREMHFFWLMSCLIYAASNLRVVSPILFYGELFGGQRQNR